METTRLRNLAAASQIAIVTTDAAGTVTSWNGAASRIFGSNAEVMIGRSIEAIMPERFRSEHEAGMRRMRTGGVSKLAGRTVELVGLRANGEEFPVEISICTWRRRLGVEFGAIIQDISERRVRESRLARLARFDPLTGLPNRSSLQAKLQQQVEEKCPGTLLLCDIRRLKEINDTMGSHTGDALLHLITLRLSSLDSKQTFIARYADDEFAILASTAMSPREMETEARSVIDVLTLPYEIDVHRVHIEVSVGIASSDDQEPDHLLARADMALLQARKPAGSSYKIFDTEIAGTAAARRVLNDQLRRATHGREWELYYQPQVRLTDGLLIGLEALLRWNHPERGLLGPADFIHVLERHFGAERVGLWILDESCRQLRAWRDSGFLVPRVAVNLFTVQFHAKSLATDVLDALARYGLEPTDLELEITEKVALNSDGHAEANLQLLAEKGVEISFDDFGTGFASLSSLKQLPVTRLKIDRSFVHDVADMPSSAAIVSAVLSIGSSLGVDVIAEGVETEQQRRQLLALGCATGQGYLFGRPMPARLVRAAVRCIS
ncbi:putative bifunctional diguanylate cyclase/phosphodiesterase [Methylobacterium sp. E-046]|uniref:putative bifunctional diguanylate cyclase/phosphodiesterase n=1 Tax=Methylobacterium sp. E-046 TaxID=2836576 RepID=UPI001FBB5237|nr:EAL domain-containing protein [Methylobacterium sp. E-046]MCJ2103075.1 EAL domain-containing protein [Methylobacterium sp. E-046]